ncbi:MAG: metal-sulfur cluster assembly factor [Sphingobacteriales bacterium]|nr:metal-sulfur cluster assembly factor [Sphingobacteriales bacterium]
MNVISNHPINCTIALAALEQVNDPELGLNVVDLGLIYQIDFDEPGNRIFVRMTLTTQFCPMGETLVAAVQRALEGVFSGWDVQVELSFDPPWNHERISEKGKEFLNR